MSSAQIESAALRFLTDPAARRDPTAFYDLLVSRSPVTTLLDGRIHLIAGYEEIVELSRVSVASTDFAAAGIDLADGFNISAVLSRMLPMRTGADHRRLRQIVNTTFSARAAAAMRPRIERIVDTLLDPLLATGRLEIVADLATPLPVLLSMALLDVPDDEVPLVRHWAELYGRSLLVSRTDPELGRRLEAELVGLRDYVDQLCERRRRRPGDDLISLLVSAHRTGQLDDEELFAFVVMLFVNGLETLTSGLSAAVWHAHRARELWAALPSRPDLAETVFDECLRLAGPVRSSGRVLVQDVTLGDRRLRAGSAVVLLYAAANRDPRRFPEPDRIIPDRAFRQHLAFGYGPHRCLGAPLSVSAGGLVLHRLATRCPDLHTPLTEADAPFDTSLVFAGLTRLPMSTSAADRLVGSAR